MRQSKEPNVFLIDDPFDSTPLTEKQKEALQFLYKQKVRVDSPVIKTRYYDTGSSGNRTTPTQHEP